MILKKANVIERKIHDTYFLIDISDNYLDDKCYLYEIDEIGGFIWQKLDILDNIHDIANSILENISVDISYAEVYDDVKGFVDILVKKEFLEKIDERKQ